MHFTVGVHHGPDFLLVVCTGPAGIADHCGVVDLIAKLAEMRSYRRALIDLTGAAPDLAFTDHLQIGAYMAERLGGLERVASVVPGKYRSGTSEKAAQRQGLGLKTFTALDEAQDWLLARS